MTDQVLDILKLVLLGLLYLFFARVLWAVWSEVRQPASARSEYVPPAQPHPGHTAAPEPTPAGGAPTPAGGRGSKPARGRGERPGRLVVIEPKARRGTAFALSGTVGIGRDPDNVIVISDDSYISSHHARVSDRGGTVVLDDLGSRNGTYLNGGRIAQQHTVRPGDRIQIGYTVLEAQ